MTTALDLLTGYLANVRDPDAAASLFAQNGAIELPYLQAIGFPWRVEGPGEIRGFLVSLLENVPDFRFIDIEHHIVTPDQVFSEYSVEAEVKATGRLYKQRYAGRLVAENGKIELLRESLETVAVVRAWLPRGLDALEPRT